MKKSVLLFILILLVALLFVANYSRFDSYVTKYLISSKQAKIERVIDGDTVVTTANEHIRLLGINAPETSSNEKYSQQAKQYLTSLIDNKSVRLESYGTDLYGRTLAYIFLGNEDANKMVVENGLANIYFPKGTGPYHSEFVQAWNDCLAKNIGVCTKSVDVCAGCVKLTELNVKTQEAIFINQCDFSCNITNWEIKDEGRKKFIFPEYILNSGASVDVKVGNETNTQNILYWPGYSYIWTAAGDTLFLRDTNRSLVLWDNY